MTNYKDAGVDIDVANEGMKRIKKHVNFFACGGLISDVEQQGGRGIFAWIPTDAK